jgi:hypothetical protein
MLKFSIQVSNSKATNFLAPPQNHLFFQQALNRLHKMTDLKKGCAQPLNTLSTTLTATQL